MSTLRDFDDDFEKAPNTPTYGDNVIDHLPDGQYEFEVATLDVKPETKAGPIVTLKLIVLSEGKFNGKKGEKVYFLTKEDKDSGQRVRDESRMSELKADLIALGFDVPNWKTSNGRPFSTMLTRAVALCAGLGFKAKKTSWGTNKDKANLKIVERLSTDGKPATFGEKELQPAPEPFTV